jgi:hypothetical protein
MTDESETYKAALDLIERHGESAASVAANHLARAQEQGDAGGERSWSRILRIIESLQANEKETDES